MTRVMAQGTFDLLHPGHIHYLRESAALGDELVVVIARDARKDDKKPLIMDEDSRQTVVDALEMVENAVLGSEESIFDSVDRLEPDIITLGYDQPYDPDDLEDTLADHGLPDIAVVRIGEYAGPTASSSDLRNRIHRGSDEG
jgi:FAD synthetase